jgi:osmotically-inducible protein OsmY
MVSVKRLAGTLIALLLLAAYAGCASTETSRATGTYVDDNAITAKVKTGLTTDSTTKARDIQVDTYRGVVQLSGFVDNQAAIDRATEIARGVEGVKDVKNSLVLREKVPAAGERKQ